MIYPQYDDWPEWSITQKWLESVKVWYGNYYPYWVDPHLGHC